MTSAFSKRMLALILFTALNSQTAFAKVYVNSMCQMKANSENKDILGDEKKGNKYPLASISKLITSLWAIEKLGPDYRFKTRLHVSPTHETDVYNIHIEGGRDPIFGRNLGYFLISELNRLQIKKINQLSFDENFLIEWLLEEGTRVGGKTPHYKTIEDQAAAVKKTLMLAFATPISSANYKRLKAKAAKIRVQMENSPSVKVASAEFIPSATYEKPPYTLTLALKSAPLKTILKRMNNQSNNYIADNMFWNLGGTDAFNTFMSEKLQADSDDFVFYNGSGNNEGSEDKPIYNQASCELMIKVLYSLDNNLANYGYNLRDIMPVAGVDSDSTLKRGYGGVMSGSMVAKTGSVNKAKTLSGAVLTNQGVIYFAVLMHTDFDHNRSDWGVAARIIKRKVSELINQADGPKRINYSEILPLPFDTGSYLDLESKATNLSNK